MDIHRRHSRRLVPPVVGLSLLLTCGAVFWTTYPEEEPASVAWAEASPESAGLDDDALERLASDLAERNTKALLVGAGHQVVWIDPELDLVAVRMGGALSAGSEPLHSVLDRHFVTPLYGALEGAEPPRENDAGVAQAPGMKPAPTICPPGGES